jgi:hypothetical protein
MHESNRKSADSISRNQYDNHFVVVASLEQVISDRPSTRLDETNRLPIPTNKTARHNHRV